MQRKIEGFSKFTNKTDKEFEIGADETIIGCFGEHYKDYEFGRLKSFGFLILGPKGKYKDDYAEEDAEIERAKQ